MTQTNRRQFLEFLGYQSAAAIAGGTLTLPTQNLWAATAQDKPRPIASSRNDDLTLSPDLSYEKVISEGELLNRRGERFGCNNDFLATLPLNKSRNDLLLWANHESPHELFVSGYDGSKPKTKAQVILEQKSVGGSFVRIKRKNLQASWKPVFDDPLNRRIDGQTKIPFASGVKVGGTSHAIGTFANCAGGVTPWGHILTCEENYDLYYGEAVYSREGRRSIKTNPKDFNWQKHFPYPPEHYGWIVEVNPKTGEAKKLTGLGRFAHEVAKTTLTKDGRCVVYSGDDGENRCVYKFVSSKPGTLEEGVLYVADFNKRTWVPLVRDRHPILQKRFKSQLEVMIRVREAAPLVGGTPMDRAEGISINPLNGDVVIAFTMNKTKQNYFGSLVKIKEHKNQPEALSFEHDTMLAGGPETGFACPDNLIFDTKGNLWFATDMSKSSMNKLKYKPFGHNSLFLVKAQGKDAGKAQRMASGPVDCELTGPWLTPDESTLMLSVQHPGEGTKSLKKLRSTWNQDKDGIPKSAVVAVKLPKIG